MYKCVTHSLESFRTLMIRCPKDRMNVEQYIWPSRCHDGIEECNGAHDENPKFAPCNKSKYHRKYSTLIYSILHYIIY